MKVLIVLNDAPYGSERTYNGLRLAGSLSRQEGAELKVFLIGDAVTGAHKGQKVPSGYYNVQTMLGAVVRRNASSVFAAVAWTPAVSPTWTSSRARGAALWTSSRPGPWKPIK